MKSSPPNSPGSSSESNPRTNPCFDRGSDTAMLEILADDGISYLLPYAQFLSAQKMPNPVLERKPEAPPEEMRVRFACGEVVVLGSGLRSLARLIQTCELRSIQSADGRLASALSTHIAALTVTLNKENS